MPLPRPAPGTGRWWVIGTVGIAAATAFAIWFGLSASLGRVTWVDTAYRVVDDRTVEVSFDVHRPGSQAVTCTVRAQDERHGTVGSLEVSVPAGGEGSVARTVEVRTTTRAVSGSVQRCVEDPAGTDG